MKLPRSRRSTVLMLLRYLKIADMPEMERLWMIQQTVNAYAFEDQEIKAAVLAAVKGEANGRS